MSVLRIIPPKGQRAQPGFGTRVETEDGTRISNIARLSIHIAPDDLIRAEVTVLPEVDEVWALPFMSEASFLDAAERYGYHVVRKGAGK